MTEAGTERDVDLVVARLHLRLGSIELARAELEELAGRGALDAAGLVDLAEARWRTGDLTGAGEAANVALDAGDERVIALVIAAEAVAAAGRPAEARRLADRAMDLDERVVADAFRGMPRASIWPIEGDAEPVAQPLFASAIGVAPGPQPVASPAAGLWDESAGIDLPDPAALLDAGRASLAEGRLEAAALHLGLAMRLAPGLAPAVLDAIEPYDGPELTLVKGDAYRLVGHERDARLAFADAAASIPATPAASSKETT